MFWANSIVSLLSFACFLLLSNFAHAQTKILVIESYHKEYPWDASYLEGIRETLDDGYDIKTFEMDTKRLPEHLFAQQAEKAWKVFQKEQPEFVILGDDNAFTFLGRRISETGTPTIYLGVNANPRDLGLFGLENLTGVLERPLFKRNVVELNRIMEGRLNSVLVLLDSGNTAKVALDEAFLDQANFTIENTQVTLKNIATQMEWENIVASSADNFDAIIVGLYHTIVDRDGRHVPADQILSWTSKHSPIPLFAFWDFAVGPGKTAGGLVLFGKTQGVEAAEMVKQIAGGESISNIWPRASQKGRFHFSISELKRWGITLPHAIEQRTLFTD